MGQFLETQQRFAEVLHAYNEASVLDREFRIAQASQGDMFLLFCCYEEEPVSFDRAYSLEESYASLQRNREKTLAVLGQFELAHCAFARVRELEVRFLGSERQG